MDFSTDARSTSRYIIDHETLEPGDVILTSEATPRSKGIRAVTGSNYSHAMICVGFASYVHAVGNGVEIANPQRVLFDSPDRVSVRRYFGKRRRIVTHAACAFVRERVGTEYSIPEAVATKIPAARRNLTNRQFCSRLVAQAYAAAGVDLVDDADYCSPQELRQSPALLDVDGCVREATEAEMQFAEEKRTALPIQAEKIATLLKDARAITGEDLQSIPQIEQHVFANGEHDEALSNALVKSGYLTIWKLDVDRNPWRYDEAKFLGLQASPMQLHTTAKKEVELALEDILRFQQAYDQVSALLRISDRRFLRLERDLYGLLVELHTRRYSTATSVLSIATTGIG